MTAEKPEHAALNRKKDWSLVGHGPKVMMITRLVGDFPPHARDVLIGNVLCKTLKWQVSHEPAQAFSDEAP